MPYIANLTTARSYLGKLVGNGQCVSFIQQVVNIPAASAWRRGTHVRGAAGMLPGTVIATFDPNGRYGNRIDGTSHAAIYLRQDAAGLHVLDQWTGRTMQPVHERLIRFKNGDGLPVNDGDAFDAVT